MGDSEVEYRTMLLSFFNLSRFSRTLSAYETDWSPIDLPVWLLSVVDLWRASADVVFLLKFMRILECGCSSSSPPNDVMYVICNKKANLNFKKVDFAKKKSCRRESESIYSKKSILYGFTFNKL